jgi:hypothetical protein
MFTLASCVLADKIKQNMDQYLNRTLAYKLMWLGMECNGSKEKKEFY